MPLGVSSSPTPITPARAATNTRTPAKQTVGSVPTPDGGGAGTGAINNGTFSNPAYNQPAAAAPTASTPPGPYASAYQYPSAANQTPQQQLSASVAAQLASLQQGAAAQQAGNNASIGLAQNNYNLQSGYMNNDAQAQYGHNANAMVNNNASMTDLNTQAALRTGLYNSQIANLGTLRGFNTTDRNNTVGYAGNVLANTNTGLANDLTTAQDRYNNLHAGSTAQFGQSIGQATLESDKGQRLNLTDNTARGAVGSRGFGQVNGEIARQLGLTTDKATSDRDLAYQSQDNDLAGAHRNFDLGSKVARDAYGNVINNANSTYAKGENSIDQTGNTLTYNQNSANSDFAKQTSFLNTTASNLGIDKGQIGNNLAQGLQSLGYSAAQQQQLLQQANSAIGTAAQGQAQAILMQALGISAQLPFTLPQTPAPAAGPATAPGVSTIDAGGGSIATTKNKPISPVTGLPVNGA